MDKAEIALQTIKNSDAQTLYHLPNEALVILLISGGMFAVNGEVELKELDKFQQEILTRMIPNYEDNAEKRMLDDIKEKGILSNFYKDMGLEE